jgi:hypothetical protein
MAFSIASLILLIAVGLGGTNKNNDGLNNLYFFRANTSDIRPDADIVDVPSFISRYLNVSEADGSNNTVVKDFYHVSLWNYCAGDLRRDRTFNKYEPSESDDVTECSKRQAQFWFNPVEVWGLDGTEAEQLFSKQLRDGLKTYKAVAKWMVISYMVAVVATAVEIVIGFFALLSRWGSLATTIASTVSSIFIISFALTATVLYATLTGVFNTALKKYNIHGSLGYNIYVITWIAVLFSCAAGLFWLFSSCCCSGRADRIKGYKDGSTKGFKATHTPYNYQRVESPFLGQSGNQQPSPSYQKSPNPQSGVPMQSMGPRSTAYEPFRHEQV